MNQIQHIALHLATEHRRRQIADAAEHHRALDATRRERRPLRRAIGRSLVRLGHALANEHDASLQPVRPR